MAWFTLQDLVVTMAAVAAVGLLVRPFLPRALGGPSSPAAGSTACASCAAGAAAARSRAKR